MTVLAVPVTAALLLHSGALEMSLLFFLQFVPYLLVGLPAGAWLDRRSKRPIMLAADCGRAVVLLAVPVAAAVGRLSLPVLLVTALVNGALNVCYEIAAAAYLPQLVGSAKLTTANSRLNASSSAAGVVGPGLAGTLIQVVGAPFALLLDAASYVASAAFVATLPTDHVTEARRDASLLSEMKQGLSVVLLNRELRALVSCSCSANVFVNANEAVFVLFALRELRLSPPDLGVLFAAGGLGALLGAVVAPGAASLVGQQRTIVLGQLLAGFSAVLIAFVGKLPWQAVFQLTSVMFAWNLGVGLYIVNSVSLRQRVTPPQLQARVAAAARLITWGIPPIGFLAGGWAGTVIGFRPTLLLAGLGVLVSTSWLLPLLRTARLPALPAPETS